jgi:hypothetical protein
LIGAGAVTVTVTLSELVIACAMLLAINPREKIARRVNKNIFVNFILIKLVINK